MGERTTISWTHHTFNPWWGCTEISPACDECYAREWAKRFGMRWGSGQPRRPASERTWAEPLKWNRKAAEAGERRRVFCASMADIFDNEAPEGLRERLWDLIRETTNLDWLLLTKRIGNAPKMLPSDWGHGYRNVWLGATVVTQEEYDRDMPKLLAVPAAIRFLSIEPILGPIDLRLDSRGVPHNKWGFPEGPCGYYCDPDGAGHVDHQTRIDWVIAGGESGRRARPAHPDWFRSLRDQCVAVGVPFHFKQWGEWIQEIPVAGGDLGGDVRAGRVTIVQGDGRQPDGHCRPGDVLMRRVGKILAGHKLDAREWLEFPRAAS